MLKNNEKRYDNKANVAQKQIHGLYYPKSYAFFLPIIYPALVQNTTHKVTKKKENQVKRRLAFDTSRFESRIYSKSALKDKQKLGSTEVSSW